MIEFCTRKRMAIAIVILISVSVVTVIVESKWSSYHRVSKEVELKGTVGPDNASMCNGEKESIMEFCIECTNFELKNEKPYCRQTGYKTRIHCGDGRDVYKSCPVNTWREEKKFLVFECITCILGIFSYSVVRYRQRRLDNMLMEKINRQIASGL